MSTLNVNCTCSVLFNWGDFIICNTLYHFGSRWYSLHIAFYAFKFPHPPHHWKFNKFHAFAQHPSDYMHPILLRHPSAIIRPVSRIFRVLSKTHFGLWCPHTISAYCPVAVEHPSIRLFCICVLSLKTNEGDIVSIDIGWIFYLNIRWDMSQTIIQQWKKKEILNQARVKPVEGDWERIGFCEMLFY